MVFKVLGLITILASSISFKTNIKRFANDDIKEKVIYVDVSLNESLKDNNPYIHFINGDKKGDIKLVLDKDNIYYSESPISIDILNKENNYFEICCDSEFVTEHISNSLLKDNNYNYVSVSNNEVIKGYGYYTEKLANPGATYKTQRIWLNKNKDINSVGYFYDNTFNMIDMLSVINSYNNNEYSYVDIPFSVSNIHFLNTDKYLINKDINVEQLSYGVCYNIDDSSISTMNVDGANASILSLVTESYLTYGKNDSNGCTESTVKNLFTTWFEHKSASSNELKETKILDYTGYASNGNSYDGLEKTSSFSVNEKWNTMCSQAGIDPKTGNKRSLINFNFLSSDTSKFVFAIGITTVVFTSLYFVLRIIKKKKYER